MSVGGGGNTLAKETLKALVFGVAAGIADLVIESNPSQYPRVIFDDAKRHVEKMACGSGVARDLGRKLRD